MKISHAFDGFEAALKSMRAAEIAALGAAGPQEHGVVEKLETTLESVRAAAIHLWSLPARGPSDLVLKARAMRWHFPDGIEVPTPARLGADDPVQDAPLGVIAMHYIVKDLLALSE